jgi:hypothetical protein
MLASGAGWPARAAGERNSSDLARSRP